MHSLTLEQFRQEVCRILVDEFEFSPDAAQAAFIDDSNEFETAFSIGETPDDAIVNMIIAAGRAHDPYREYRADTRH